MSDAEMSPLEKQIRLSWGPLLKARCGIEFREVHATDKQIRIVARLEHDKVKTFLDIVSSLLTASSKSSWKLDVSKHYFLKEGALVFSWRLIFQAPVAQDIVEPVRGLIQRLPLPAVPDEVVVRLPISGELNRPVRGKGASNIKAGPRS